MEYETLPRILDKKLQRSPICKIWLAFSGMRTGAGTQVEIVQAQVQKFKVGFKRIGSPGLAHDSQFIEMGSLFHT